jgi:hypothetical protein
MPPCRPPVRARRGRPQALDRPRRGHELGRLAALTDLRATVARIVVVDDDPAAIAAEVATRPRRARWW